MMIASHQLLKAGFQVITYHPLLRELSSWFPEHSFIDQLPSLSLFDLVIIENDNSPKMHLWKAQFPQSSIFYPSYHSQKNPLFTQNDFLFNPHQTMADNIARSISSLLKQPFSKENGIVPPPHLIHQKNAKRILIHPTSSSEEKNWLKKRYLKLKDQLEKKGFNPLFVMHISEKEKWGEPASLFFNRLDDLAEIVYQSGSIIGNDSLLGHLGSNLNIATWIIANDAKRMELWKPGWHPGKVITPYRWIPNSKGLRLRKKWWKELISTKRVISIFEKDVRKARSPSLLSPL